MSEPAPSQDSSKKRAPGPDDVKTAFKKRGQFDALRKELFQRLLADPAHSQLQESIRTLALEELGRDRALRARDRGKAASLLEGVMERGEIYDEVTKYFDAGLEGDRKRIERMVREVYKDLGGELSEEEEEEEEEVPKEEVDEKKDGGVDNMDVDSEKAKDSDKVEDGSEKKADADNLSVKEETKSESSIEEKTTNGVSTSSPRDIEMKDGDSGEKASKDDSKEDRPAESEGPKTNGEAATDHT